MLWDLGSRVQSLGYRVESLGFVVWTGKWNHSRTGSSTVGSAPSAANCFRAQGVITIVQLVRLRPLRTGRNALSLTVAFLVLFKPEVSHLRCSVSCFRTRGAFSCFSSLKRFNIKISCLHSCYKCVRSVYCLGLGPKRFGRATAGNRLWGLGFRV
jgi:hypothetical protein